MSNGIDCNENCATCIDVHCAIPKAEVAPRAGAWIETLLQPDHLLHPNTVASGGTDLPSKCCYCQKPADGAMLKMGNSIAHVDCVIRELIQIIENLNVWFGEEKDGKEN